MPTVLKPTSATISAGLQEKAADNRDKDHRNKQPFTTTVKTRRAASIDAARLLMSENSIFTLFPTWVLSKILIQINLATWNRIPIVFIFISTCTAHITVNISILHSNVRI